MMMPENPWDSLHPGGIDARRVSTPGKQDFFWIISGEGEPGLMLRLCEGAEEIKPLPKMRNLEIAYRDAGGKRALLILLKDNEQRELFVTLCHDIVRAGEAASDNQDALARALKRTLRWHHLLRGGKGDQLSLEEQRGLLGELQFLKHLIANIGPRAAIEAWKGPLGSSKDFELDGCLVEVKARRGAAKPYVQISSEDQLADVHGCRLFLVVSPVDAVVKPSGQTLTDYVSDVDRIFAALDLDSYVLWEECLEAIGFDFEDDYSDRRWVIGQSLQFEVKDGFPRVPLPLPAGVSGVRYSIGLDACSPFSVDPEELTQLIIERNG